MSQTTLNLIAIAVFLVTMLSLLGPLIQVSPEFLAIAVAAVFGLTTLDRFGWQGQGGTLLIDQFAQWSPGHRQRVLHHEAGHFLVAYLLDIPVIGYTLTAWEAWQSGVPGQGGVVFDTQAIDACLDQQRISSQLIDRYCTVWMAGIAAETLAAGSATGGNDDRQKIQVLWQQLQRSPNETGSKQRWALLQATRLIQDQDQAYQALVAAMENRESVESCYRLLGINKKSLSNS